MDNEPLLGVSTTSQSTGGPLAEPGLAPPDLAGRALDEPPAWPPAAQATLMVLVGVGLLLVSWHVYSGSRWAARPLELDPPRLDLNRASLAEIRQLPGVGEAMARRIVAARSSLQGFRDIEDLRKVQGIGQLTLDRLRNLVEIGPYEQEERPPPPPRVVRGARPEEPDPPPPPVYTRKEPPAAPIDVNSAPAAELQKLPGIGPKLAQALITARQVKPFGTVEELRRVRGIGPKTIERLRPHVRFDTAP